MMYFKRGYKDGFDLALCTDSHVAFDEARDEIERALQELRRCAMNASPADLRNVFRAYVARSAYYAGFLEGYWYARRDNPAPGVYDGAYACE